MKALVTGGGGFVGRALIAQLQAQGARAVAFGPDDWPPDGPPVERIIGSVIDRTAVASAVHTVQPDVIFHLAAFGVGGAGLIRSAVVAPLDSVRVNVLGTSVVCQVAIEHGVERLVWSSSTSVFGSVAPERQHPQDEDADPRPDTLYGATKLSSELLVQRLSQEGRTRVTGLRLPGVYGAGRYPGALADLTTFVTDVALERPASIEAPTYAVDWMHVHDAAGALMRASTLALPRPMYNVVGHRCSLADMARAAATHAIAPAEVTAVAVTSLVPELMDPRRFAAEADFKPEFDLSRGVAEYVAAERRKGA